MDMSSPSLAQAADTPVPDARGINLYRADPMAAALFATYLPAPLMAHLAPQAFQCSRILQRILYM